MLLSGCVRDGDFVFRLIDGGESYRRPGCAGELRLRVAGDNTLAVEYELTSYVRACVVTSRWVGHNGKFESTS